MKFPSLLISAALVSSLVSGEDAVRQASFAAKAVPRRAPNAVPPQQKQPVVEEPIVPRVKSQYVPGDQQAPRSQNPYGAAHQQAPKHQDPYGAAQQQAPKPQNPYGAAQQQAPKAQNPYGAAHQQAQKPQDPYAHQQAQRPQDPHAHQRPEHGKAPATEARPENPYYNQEMVNNIRQATQKMAERFRETGPAKGAAAGEGAKAGNKDDFWGSLRQATQQFAQNMKQEQGDKKANMDDLMGGRKAEEGEPKRRYDPAEFQNSMRKMSQELGLDKLFEGKPAEGPAGEGKKFDADDFGRAFREVSEKLGLNDYLNGPKRDTAGPDAKQPGTPESAQKDDKKPGNFLDDLLSSMNPGDKKAGDSNFFADFLNNMNLGNKSKNLGDKKANPDDKKANFDDDLAYPWGGWYDRHSQRHAKKYEGKHRNPYKGEPARMLDSSDDYTSLSDSEL